MLEQRINELLEQNQQVYEEKARIMHDLESANNYISDLESKIYQQNSTSLGLLK